MRPRDDIVWHPLDRACACGPTVEVIDDPRVPLGWLVTHHALDGRGTGQRPPDA